MTTNLDLIRRRFNMSPLPARTDDKFEEKLTNWFLEGAFFRDFVYRDQRGKGGRGELADGLVLFDDHALFVQSKAQSGNRDGKAWARKNIREAVRQVGYGERMLRERHVSQVVSDTLGPVAFDPVRFHRRIGLVVVQQDDATAFDANALVPEVGQQTFPVHVLSLMDLMEVAQRFDTAPDFLFYLEERRELAQAGVPLQMHREIEMARRMLELMPERLRQFRPGVSEEVAAKTIEAFRSKVTGDLQRSEGWRRSMLVDDAIAHLHDNDPSLPWNMGATPAGTAKAIELLSYLTRDRRVFLGEKMLTAAQAATDGASRAFWHGLRHNSCCYVFLYSDLPRPERLERAHAYLLMGMALSGLERGIVVATNSVALGGRAYDAIVRLDPLPEEQRTMCLALPSPFGI